MRHIRAALFAFTLVVGAGFVSAASAQEPDAAEDRAMAFEAADGAQTENIPGGGLLIGAYGIVWLVVLGYVLSLGYRQARTRDDIERLRRDLASAKQRAEER